MIISINNEEKVVSSNVLNSILSELNFSELKGIAVAVNQEVISQSEWDSYSISEKDEIILIQATQGGWHLLKMTISKWNDISEFWMLKIWKLKAELYNGTRTYPK